MNVIPNLPLSTPRTISALTSDELAPLFLPPGRIGLPSSWWGHVPFAHWLVSEIRPRLIVELGTQHGVSFAALCNAVQQAGLSARCYAVDTWQGDEHAGEYDRSVFDNINAFNTQHFASFATLIRSSFREARGSFADGTIDLLHIDGFHTYDAVKEDFETWLPKVSARGIVLFHDIAVHEKDFGVWKFWSELRDRYPSFEFRHSCGLGILATGPDIPDFVLGLTQLDEDTAVTLRQRVSDLGERWISTDDRHRITADRDLMGVHYRNIRAVNEGLQNETAAAKQAAEAARESAAAAVQAQEQAIAQAQTQMQTQAQEHALALAQAQTEQAQAQAEISMLRLQLATVSGDADTLRRHIEQIRVSTSWRMSGPYRIAGRFAKQWLLGPFSNRRRFKDYRVIAQSKLFYPNFYLGRVPSPGEEDPLLEYLAASRAAAPLSRPSAGPALRRPTLGFHPLAYAAEHKECDTSGEDPLAHYIRNGLPPGRWRHDIIHADHPLPQPGAQLRVVIHCHFHYPEFLPDFLRRLGQNASRADLFITTTSEAKRGDIVRALEVFGETTASIHVVPNRGRNIGPLLALFAQLEHYDVVGHIHGKRSPQTVQSYGDNWRAFLWDHLVGGDYPTMDSIIQAFADDEKLGLVFPEDPNLNAWDINRSIAEGIASRMGRTTPLPHHFEFPKGGMFWVRPAALRPLVDLGWTSESFPEEPVAFDGTILHALERIIPFAAEQAGFVYKTTHVPNSLRS